MTHIECRTCGATLRVDDSHRSTVCPYCASPSVIERPASGDAIPPKFAVGFGVPRERAVENVRAWSRHGLFRHAGLEGAPIEDIRGIYVPAWLYSAVAEADFTAEIGENYTVTRTRTVTRNGQTVTETYTTTETEWRPLGGRYLGYVADVLVTASKGLANHELEALEPFDLRALTRFTPAVISGWLAEDVTLAANESAQHARAEACEIIARRMKEFMPGDAYRGLSHQTSLASESSDVVLVPVWVLAMRHVADAPPVRVLVNGQNGKVVGDKPLSWWKVTIAVLMALALVALCVLFMVGVTQ